MNKKFHNVAVLVEFIAGSGLAIFFHWVLHYKEAAYTIFGIGILLSLVTYLIREEIEKTREDVLESYTHAHEITFAIARIEDPECQIRARELLSSSMRTISLLEQGFIPLEEMEYHLEGAKQMEQAFHSVKTVDPLSSGLDLRGALVNFYQAEQRARERGIRVSRIFIGSREELAMPEFQKILTALHHENVGVRIAFRDELPPIGAIGKNDTVNSLDFAIYDDRVVVDVYGKTGKYFGKKTARTSEVAKYLHLYDLIEHSSHAVTLEQDRIVPANDFMPIAA
ncbi:hypothetical protein [Geobacter sp. SVR]|uniref:hypothetical protein n=1 Tax=Geobacter sp. SVR TaxID=2495594 RepID=UPI00143EF54B|nr:hypothetical protein [Geobacter sp. SVR]BCS54365.1 hypothetical protein GSVR_26730 [Geobacter sp. SVR]GCF87466.1 hypothetical protein GSbR_40660 [Geobacter sp. SVR]